MARIDLWLIARLIDADRRAAGVRDRASLRWL
jgi:hypothetical protein